MRQISLLIIILNIASCSNNPDSSKQIVDGQVREESSFSDNTSDEVLKYQAKKVADSLIKDVTRSFLFDTTGLYLSPVKVLKYRLYKEGYSSYRNISVTYRNNSRKKISAIRFTWYGTNAFKEPADMGGYGLLKGFGGGYDDNVLNVGSSRTSSWEILSSDAKKVILAWPTEVMFSDGSKWDITRPNDYLKSIDTLPGIKKIKSLN
jgi:hypothetical protein